MHLIAASDASVSIIVAFVALAAAGVTAVGAIIAKFRESKDTLDIAAQTRELGLIHETQDSLVSLIDTQRAELAAARQEIVGLRSQVAEMRHELASALQHHAECEEARVGQDKVIAGLRAQIQGGIP